MEKPPPGVHIFLYLFDFLFTPRGCLRLQQFARVGSRRILQRTTFLWLCLCLGFLKRKYRACCSAHQKMLSCIALFRKQPVWWSRLRYRNLPHLASTNIEAGCILLFGWRGGSPYAVFIGNACNRSSATCTNSQLWL